MNVIIKNLLADVCASSSQEEFLTLLETGSFRIERIVSNGQCSPRDFWYDQEQNEWVILLKGSATLQFDGGIVKLSAGDYLLIERHVKHRVETSSADALWLAVHYNGGHVQIRQGDRCIGD